ncbi:MAG: aminotransferase class V-fold PLP-dependent enzyme [Cytophagaceae bacterium]
MEEHQFTPILVLGGDGYLGWPLALKLALKNPDKRILIADNEWRRKTVKKLGSDSVLPIAEPQQRIEAFQRIYNQNNLEFINLNVNSPELEKLIAKEKPQIIYHLAQQCSAPYSMKGMEEAIYTLQNNEAGNMRILWAIREHVPDAHLIKLGTFGEYAKGGIDIAEGYFFPEYNGKKANTAVPYPRESDDIYHITKINDSNFVSLACRKWGLKITDIMQSTVFGAWTEEIGTHPELYTRLDYDSTFGTVLNRFTAQMLVGNPLTVYGTGHQRTGLMALNDCISSMAEIWKSVPAKGVHRVINHVTEKAHSINDLAEAMSNIGREEGFQVEVTRVFDPRFERPEAKMEYKIETNYLDGKIEMTPLHEVIRQTLRMIRNYKQRISPAIIPPVTQWAKDVPAESSPLSVELISPEPKRAFAIPDNEAEWIEFQEQNFPNKRINLNPGTLGAPSKGVRKAIRKFLDEGDLAAFPLGQYQKAREILQKVRELGKEIWNSPAHDMTVTASASQCSNLLSLAIARRFKKDNSDAIRILTTQHEHYGGIKSFQKLNDYEVSYLKDDEMADESLFLRKLDEVKPQVAFFSHICYDTGQLLPVELWARHIKQLYPDCIIIIDVAQSLGIYEPPFMHTDAVFGSTHKWLFGPQGGGLLWTTSDFRKWVGGINWGGEGIDQEKDYAQFSIPGGQNFTLYAGLEAALKLYKKVGGITIRKRASALAGYFKGRMDNIIRSLDVEAKVFSPCQESEVLPTNTVECSAAMMVVAFVNYDPYMLYMNLNEMGIHVKCIKNKALNGKLYNILRFGFPYFESKERLDIVLQRIESILMQGAQPVLKKAV